MRRLLFVFGTRPEAIKLCPVVLHFRKHAPEFDVRVCVTAQHRGLLDQVLEVFGITPDHDLDLMLPSQTLFQSTSRILSGLEPVLIQESPDMVYVQGDTTTTLCGALAAFYRQIPVAHVEAGLRTGDMSEPFPEEMNRVLCSRLTSLHLAATAGAARHLTQEGVPDRDIAVTGNTCIDAVLYVRDGLESGSLQAPPLPPFDAMKKLLLVTAHRRESFGEGFEQICMALAYLARRDDVQIVYPVHPNPNVQGPVNRHLRGLDNIVLVEPLSYVPFVDLMRRAYLLITDSGGVQEEGPSLGKPILVMRDKTERPEAVEAGCAVLVGTARSTILAAIERLWRDKTAYRQMQETGNPFGDGAASQRIVFTLERHFSISKATAFAAA